MVEAIIHRIVVKPDTLEDVDPVYKKAKEAGITFAELDEIKMERNAVDRGTVIEVGPTAFIDYHGVDVVKPGDYIAYAKYAGKTVKDFDGTEYLVINDEDVVCKLTKEPANG